MKSSVTIIRCMAVCILFLYSAAAKSQTLTTYYAYGIGMGNLSDLAFDDAGNLYANTGDKIAKISSQGVVTILVNGNFYYKSLLVKTDGTVYFVDDRSWPWVIKKVSANGLVSDVLTGDYYPTGLTLDNGGNLFFIDQMNWPYKIIKVTPDGSATSLTDGLDMDPFNLTPDASGNLFFIDRYNWPWQIKKIDPAGNLTTFVSGDYYPGNLSTDNSGNLFFIDQTNWPWVINKVTPEGNVSLHANGDYYPASLTADANGNLYFIDQNTWPNQLIKVSPGGSVSANLSGGYYPESRSDIWSDYFSKSIAFDTQGNTYFIDNSNAKIVKLINAPCSTPAAPLVRDTAICTLSNVTLTASGIGDLNWYDEPTGGTLVQSGANYSINAVNADTTLYVETNYCDVSSQRIAINITTLPLPTASISGSSTGTDYVTLTAAGGVSNLWSGGSNVTNPTNIFTRSGNYSVTVYNAEGCSNTAAVLVTINKMGVNRYGMITGNTAEQQDKRGKPGAPTKVSKHGRISSTAPVDNMLNYTIYANNASGYAWNAVDMDNLTSPANQTSSGIDMASLLIDWTNSGELIASGIAVPNGGERFALQASGFFVPSETGTYTFSCEGDDAVDLFIDGVNVTNHYGAHGIAGIGSHTGTINLQAGVKYTFRARMQENGGGEGLLVYWRKPSETSGWSIDEDELSSY